MSTLEQAHTAVDSCDWQATYDALSAVDDEGGLAGGDLERLAQAASWTGRIHDVLAVYERAYAAHLAEGNRVRAGFVALRLASRYGHYLKPPVASGWQDRAVRLLAAEPEAAEHGYLALAHAVAAWSEGQLDEAIEQARKARAIAQRFDDRELAVLAVHKEGTLLLAQGDTTAGLGLVDEACAAAVSGALGPLTTATIYCDTISVYQDLSDYGRAAEWIETMASWCERRAIRGFPGVCRVYRAEIWRLRGALAEAERDARLATTELEEPAPDLAGAAFHELGEIRLRLADLDGAEEAFRTARRLGTDPQPGLALLRLARGDLLGASGTIARALAERTWDRLARARLLPAEAEIAAAADDVDVVVAAAQELSAIADGYGTPALSAAAAAARGRACLAAGDAAGASEALRRAAELWTQVGAPYEAAKARLALGEACAAGGDSAAAELELRAARDGVARLDAGLDITLERR